MKKTTKILALLLALVFVTAGIASCKTAEPVKINIATIKGPTGIGMAKLMADTDNGSAKNDYLFEIVAAPAEIVGKLTSGEVDIAAMPTNLAANLYAKSKNITMISLTAKGVLYILEKGESVKTIEDLRGKTIYTAGQGSNPEYILKYVLESAGLKVGEDVYIEFLADHDEVATLFAAGTAEIVMLPEPNVTAVLGKVENAKIALDMTEQWSKIENAGELIMSCVVVRNEFLENNQTAVKTFLEEYKSSIEYMNNNIEEAGELCADYGIVPSAAIAKTAIPRCSLVFIEKTEMKPAIENYFNVLFTANAASIGGAIPDDNFYFTK